MNKCKHGKKMSQWAGKKVMLAAIMTIAILVVFSGCAPQSKAATPFQAIFCAISLDNEAIIEYGDSLTLEMPELTIDGSKPLFTPFIIGGVDNGIESVVINDPMMDMAGMMKISSMTATGEVDIVVSDLENAARNARGDMFISLDEIFTIDELADIEDRLLSFDMVDSDGYDATPTGEMTPICGINITGNEAMSKIFGNQDIGVFISTNAEYLDIAKAVMLTLIN